MTNVTKNGIPNHRARHQNFVVCTPISILTDIRTLHRNKMFWRLIKFITWSLFL